MMRVDMDGLPVEEKSGLSYASKVTQKDLITGNVVPVTHACSHDVHITSLVGTARRLKKVWRARMGDDAVVDIPTKGMGAEDFPYFTTDPAIPSVYFTVGGTAKKDFERARAGGPAVLSHHSPLFKIMPEPAVKSGVEATVYALLDT